MPDRNLASQDQIAPKRAQKAKPSIYWWFGVSGWSTGVTHRYFLHLDSTRLSRNVIPACNKPCNKFITENYYISLKNYYIVSKIITSGFVVDHEAQEEFDNNSWCFVKFRCSTLYFATSETCRFGFWGSVRPKSSPFWAGVRYATGDETMVEFEPKR